MLAAVVSGALLFACGGSPGPATGGEPAEPSWSWPAGAVTVELSGGDLQPRRGVSTATGGLLLDDGQVRQLRPATRTAMAQWVSDPADLIAVVTAQTCDFGTDQRYLAITLAEDPGVPQPLRLCLDEARRYRAAVTDLADVLTA